MQTQTIAITLILLIIFFGVIWRFSLRRALPCPSWLSWFVELDNPFAQAHKADVIIKHLALAPGMKVIDIGCGPGRLTIPIALTVGPQGKVIALDIQQEMLRKVQEKAEKMKLANIEYLNINIGNGDALENNQYDRAVSVAVLGEIPNQTLALKEIFDALKSGGILSITETVFDPHCQSKGKISKLAKEIGFEIDACIGNRIAFTMHLRKP